jgi:hypothetical protein
LALTNTSSNCGAHRKQSQLRQQADGDNTQGPNGMVQTWVAQKTLKRNILRVFSMSDLINSLTPKPKSVLAGTNNSRSKGFWLANTRLTNIPTMMEPFSPPAAWFCWPRVPHPRAPLRKGLGKVTFNGLVLSLN